MKRIVAKYQALPKWLRFVLRFVLYYGAAPVWLPVMLVLCATGVLLMWPILKAIEAWENFE